MWPYNLLLLDESGRVCRIELLDAAEEDEAVEAAETAVATGHLAGYELWRGRTQVSRRVAIVRPSKPTYQS